MFKLLLLPLTFLIGGCSVFGYNHDTKEPPFSVVEQDGAFQIREYKQIVMVKTTGKGDFTAAQDESFYKLFDYISGENMGAQEIPMTAPVLMEDQKGQEIPMTAPVFMEKGEDETWAMSFILPADMTLETAPKPKDESLSLTEMKDARFAAITFTGRFTEANFTAQEKALRDWMDGKKLQASGPAIRAGYNPPWTLPFLRRNEIFIPLEK